MRRVARFKDAHAMFYKPEMVDPWRVPHDSVAALSDAIEQLTMWLESTDRSLPGVRVLERRRRDCVEEYTESCRRRTEEGRPLPANLENVLKAEWTVMSNAASQLRAKVVPMMTWQEEQLRNSREAYERVGRSLDPLFETRDAYSRMSLKDAIDITIMGQGRVSTHHSLGPEEAAATHVLNHWSHQTEGGRREVAGGGGGGAEEEEQGAGINCVVM